MDREYRKGTLPYFAAIILRRSLAGKPALSKARKSESIAAVRRTSSTALILANPLRSIAWPRFRLGLSFLFILTFYHGRATEDGSIPPTPHKSGARSRT